MGSCRYSASGLSSDTTGPEKDHGWNIRTDNIARKLSAQFRWEIMKHVLLAHLFSIFALTPCSTHRLMSRLSPLPRRLRCAEHFLDVHDRELLTKCLAINSVP